MNPEDELKGDYNLWTFFAGSSRQRLISFEVIIVTLFEWVSYKLEFRKEKERRINVTLKKLIKDNKNV